MKKLNKALLSVLLVLTVLVSFLPTVSLAAQTNPPSGTYYISHNQKCVNVYANDVGDIKNNTKINLWSPTEHATQQFTLKKQSNGTYKILTQKSDYTLNISSLKSGASIICFRDTTKNTEYFIIEPVGNGYSIKPNKAPHLAVTVVGSNLTLKKYTGSSNQIFTLTEIPKIDTAKNTAVNPDSDEVIQSPVEKRKITSAFQPYYRQDFKDEFSHVGVDYISSASNLKIYAFYKGTVSKVAYNDAAGYYIEIKHTYNGKTFYSYYFHLKKNSTLVKKGDVVYTGQQISTMGTTGTSTGVHLHFQITDKSVVNSDGSLHNPKNNTKYKSWSKEKQSSTKSYTSSRKITFYNPENILKNGLSAIK